MKLFRGLPGTVVVFGLVSLLTDISSEMIYPLLPVFLATAIGAGPALLGVIEGVEKAYVADLADPAERGRAFGWFNFAIGAGALPASLIFGFIWQWQGSQAAFFFGCLLAGLAALLLLASGGGVRATQGGENHAS